MVCDWIFRLQKVFSVKLKMLISNLVSDFALLTVIICGTTHAQTDTSAVLTIYLNKSDAKQRDTPTLRPATAAAAAVGRVLVHDVDFPDY